MSQLIIANVAAPFLLSNTGNIWIFISIIPVEMLVIFLFFKLSEITIRFSRLFIAVFVANTATSILGIPLVFNGMIAGSTVTKNGVLLISFILSFLIESVIYGFSFKTKLIPKSKIILASFFSNLASYTIFFFALTGVNYNNGESLFLTPNPKSVSRELKALVIPSYIHGQKSFYFDKNRFASNWEELGLGVEKEDKHLFFRVDSQGDATKASLTATSKREDVKSYRLTIFVVKDKFIQGICETDKPSMTPPKMPQLINGKFQCPPGSSDKSKYFRLGER
jgi:hypothetical protein